MRKILALFAIDTDFQTACLCVSQVGAASYLKVFLLTRRPCLYVHRLHLQISQVAGAALQSTYRDVHGTEQVYGVLPQTIKPHLAVLRLADYDHFLLLELVDTVYASLLQTVGALLFTEAGRIASQSLRQLVLLKNTIDELTNHGMLAGTDQIQVLALDLVHHSVHLCEAHNAGYHIAADHERRYAVGKASVDHEVAGISQHCGMQSCDVAHQVVETISGYLSCAVQVDAVEALHNLSVIRNLEIRYHRLAVALNLYVLAVVFTDRYTRIDDIRDGHHILQDLLIQFFLFLRKLCQTVCLCGYLLLDLFCLFLLALAHQRANLLGKLVTLCTQVICFLLSCSLLSVQRNDLVYQAQLLILELVTDVLFYDFRVFSYKFYIQHDFSPLLLSILIFTLYFII